ncbi:hypothetical protein GCM10023163_02760 [Aestuariibaculum suncheonense]
MASEVFTILYPKEELTIKKNKKDLILSTISLNLLKSVEASEPYFIRRMRYKINAGIMTLKF